MLPQAKLRLVGKGADGLAVSGSNGVERLGYVDDPAAEIATWSAMVVPIRFGGGTRIKIAEGFARNCPVVATSVGAFGYDVRSERELMMADAPVEFADACIRLATDTSLSRAIRDEAWRRFQVEWSWDASASAIRRALLTARMDRGRHDPRAVAAVTQDC
jgi:glycosyltransferase involved in cell wall biosynthesis